jgi:hypothetical protein
MLVATLLDQDVQHLALIINRTPEIHPPAADLHDHLVQMPASGWQATALAKVGRDQRPKLVWPGPNRLSADIHAMPRKQFLDVAEAQREP